MRAASRACKALTYPNGEAATYAYSTGQPSVLTMTVGGVAKNMVTGASFEPTGRLSGYTHGNGLVRDDAFDLDGRYSTITSKNGAAAVQSLGYVYDTDDRITTISNNTPNYGESYGYDALSRLTSATGWGYTYDGNGNRQTLSPNSSVYTYVAGTNRIASVSNVFIAPDGTIVTGADPSTPDYVSSFTHDGAGNITKWDFPATLTASYTYDPFNRMSAVLDTTAGSTTLGQYGYNSFGERTSKRDLTHANNYAFIYGEGHDLIAERENGVWSNYVWFAGELVGMTRAGAVYQIDNDHLGRPELITNASKTVVWQSNNDPFGGMTTTTNTLGEFNIGFPGQYYDAETHYWYNVNRYYVAALGRYLQADPAGMGGELNPYAYAGNNPANTIDALGLASYSYDFVGPLNVGDNRCSLEGSDAIESAFPEGYLLGGGRLAYAGLARAIPYIAAGMESSAVGEATLAVATRNALKDPFRLFAFSNASKPSFGDLYAKYGGDILQIIAGSGRTNGAYNVLGAAGAGIAAASDANAGGSTSSCDCSQ